MAMSALPVPRRAFMDRVLLGSAAAAIGAGVGSPGEANALFNGAGGDDSFSREMASYGIKDNKPCPAGFTPITGFYGKAVRGQDPLLITYNSPNGWIVTRPNIDLNGEDGTVSSGDYAKGDSAALFVAPPLKEGETLDTMPREFFDKIVFDGITQKGQSLVQNYKLKKVGEVWFVQRECHRVRANVRRCGSLRRGGEW